jgi:flagellar FliJ protein
MKKFRFTLDVVKLYKEKLLDNLKIEQAAILAAIAEQKKLIAQMEETERLVNSELNEKNSNGIAPHEHVNYKRYLRVLANDINEEYEKLKKLEIAAEEKRIEIMEMKKETTALEKLEKKKIEEYNVMVRKEQELFIEEFVGNQKYSR